MDFLGRLRKHPWGIRLLGLVGMIIHIPFQLWLERTDIAFAYRVYWKAIKTGGDV